MAGLVRSPNDTLATGAPEPGTGEAVSVLGLAERGGGMGVGGGAA
jgi:hypothetical protein